MSHGTYSLKRRKKERRHDPEKLRYMKKTAASKEMDEYRSVFYGEFNWRRSGGDRRAAVAPGSEGDVERRLIPRRPIMYTAVEMEAEFCAIRQQYLEQPWNCQTFRLDQDKLTTTHAWRK